MNRGRYKYINFRTNINKNQLLETNDNSNINKNQLLETNDNSNSVKNEVNVMKFIGTGNYEIGKLLDTSINQYKLTVY